MTYNSDILEYFNKLKHILNNVSIESISEVIKILEEACDNNKTIYIMGNGGSAATASHFVCDFNKGLIRDQKPNYRFICLNDNIPTMMAYANDYEWDEIFVGPLRRVLQKKDVVIGISGSGNSNNVIKAIEWANQNEGITIALTGYDGGLLKKCAQFNIHVPVNDMQITEDIHMILDHCMMSVLCKK